MTITWLCLFWLFFFYSFIGWCIEVCAAAVQHRKFVNRGFVAGPLCPIYGFGAILFEIFLPELTEDPFSCSWVVLFWLPCWNISRECFRESL